MREWSSFLLDWTADNITDKKEIQVQVDLVLACQLQKQSYRRIKVKLPHLRDRQTGDPLEAVVTVSSGLDLLTMQAQARQVHMADAMLEYVTSLAEASRSHPLVVLGVSPRGALAVCRMCKSRAFMEGRDYVLPDDVAYIFADVCAHRLILSPKAKITETTAKDVLAEVLQQVPRPDHI